MKEELDELSHSYQKLSETSMQEASKMNALGDMIGEGHKRNPGHTKRQVSIKAKRAKNKQAKAARKTSRR